MGAAEWMYQPSLHESLRANRLPPRQVLRLPLLFASPGRLNAAAAGYETNAEAFPQPISYIAHLSTKQMAHPFFSFPNMLLIVPP